jgi:hypothetical protein
MTGEHTHKNMLEVTEIEEVDLWHFRIYERRRGDAFAVTVTAVRGDFGERSFRAGTHLTHLRGEHLMVASVGNKNLEPSVLDIERNEDGSMSLILCYETDLLGEKWRGMLVDPDFIAVGDRLAC